MAGAAVVLRGPAVRPGPRLGEPVIARLAWRLLLALAWVVMLAAGLAVSVLLMNSGAFG